MGGSTTLSDHLVTGKRGRRDLATSSPREGVLEAAANRRQALPRRSAQHGARPLGSESIVEDVEGSRFTLRPPEDAVIQHFEQDVPSSSPRSSRRAARSPSAKHSGPKELGRFAIANELGRNPLRVEACERAIQRRSRSSARGRGRKSLRLQRPRSRTSRWERASAIETDGERRISLTARLPRQYTTCVRAIKAGDLQREIAQILPVPRHSMCPSPPWSVGGIIDWLSKPFGHDARSRPASSRGAGRGLAAFAARSSRRCALSGAAVLGGASASVDSRDPLETAGAPRAPSRRPHPTATATPRPPLRRDRSATVDTDSAPPLHAHAAEEEANGGEVSRGGPKSHEKAARNFAACDRPRRGAVSEFEPDQRHQHRANPPLRRPTEDPSSLSRSTSMPWTRPHPGIFLAVHPLRAVRAVAGLGGARTTSPAATAGFRTTFAPAASPSSRHAPAWPCATSAATSRALWARRPDGRSRPPPAPLASLSISGEFRGLSTAGRPQWSEGGGFSGRRVQFQDCPGATCPESTTLGTYGVPSAARPCGSASAAARALPEQRITGAVQVTKPASASTTPRWPAVRIAGGSLVDGNWHVGDQPWSWMPAITPASRRCVPTSTASSGPSSRAPACAWGIALPCPNGGGTIPVATTGLSDGAHTLTIEAVDTGGLGVERHANHPRRQHGSRAADPAGARRRRWWAPKNEFSLRWTDPRQSAAPIVAAV